MSRLIDPKDSQLRALFLNLRRAVAEIDAQFDTESAARERAAASLDNRIMVACQHLAKCVRQCEQARFAGVREVAARRALDDAARVVERLMRERKHGAVRDSAGMLGPDWSGDE